MPEHTISQLGNKYHDWVRSHPQAAAEFAEAIEDALDDAGVVYDRVATRIKGWPSLKAKAKKRREGGEPVYPDPWKDINDVLGVRITVFHSTVIPEVIDVLGKTFTVHRSVDKAAETRISGGFGYGSHHLILEVDGAHDELRDYVGFIFEVQIRTVLQHAWAEFEHDIRYKQGHKAPSPQVDRLFTLAAGLIELADQQFDEIAALMDINPDTRTNVEITAETLPGVLAVLLGDGYPRSHADRYRFLEELLEAHGIESLSQLKDLVAAADIQFLKDALRYRIQPGQIRLIDDLLLARYRKEHVTKTAGLGDRADRKRRLNRRLKQIESHT